MTLAVWHIKLLFVLQSINQSLYYITILGNHILLHTPSNPQPTIAHLSLIDGARVVLVKAAIHLGPLVHEGKQLTKLLQVDGPRVVPVKHGCGGEALLEVVVKPWWPMM